MPTREADEKRHREIVASSSFSFFVSVYLLDNSGHRGSSRPSSRVALLVALGLPLFCSSSSFIYLFFVGKRCAASKSTNQRGEKKKRAVEPAPKERERKKARHSLRTGAVAGRCATPGGEEEVARPFSLPSFFSFFFFLSLSSSP